MNYRSIWKRHHGPIPKDESGRIFDIHHIDGNRSNNSVDNLIAVSLEDHFDIHYKQGDWAAAFRIAQRAEMAPELKSELMSLSNRRRLEDNNHPFLLSDVREKAMTLTHKRVEAGIQGFQNPEVSKKAVQAKKDKYSSEELSEHTKKGWIAWKAVNGDATLRTLQGSQAGAEKVRGTKWFHKKDGSQLRTFPSDPRIKQDGWIPGRFNGKELSANANSHKLRTLKLK